MKTGVWILSTLLLLFEPAASYAQACPFSAAQARFGELLASESLPGGALLIGTRQGVLLEHYVGSYNAATVEPIASASKLLGAIRIAQLIDRGAIDPEAPVSQYLPQFFGAKGTMSVRQMFSHTAGYGDDSGALVVFDPQITLEEAVNLIACCRALNPGYSVGGQFSYGGVSMHIAGRVAEVRGGGDWQSQWQSQLGAPLGITTIDWEAFGPTLNYGIAGSARSNLRDYGRALHLLVNDGRSNGIRLLSKSTVRRFWVDQVGPLPIAYAPENAPLPVRYGMGSWMDGNRPATEAPFIHSLGALGFFPWIDFDRQAFGVFMLRGSVGVNQRTLPVYTEMLTSIMQEIDNGECQPVERFDEIMLDGFDQQAT